MFFVDISHSSVEKFFQVLEENDALIENLVGLTTHKVHCRSCVDLIDFHSTPIIQEALEHKPSKKESTESRIAKPFQWRLCPNPLRQLNSSYFVLEIARISLLK
jgi:hypothetical protein